MPPGQRRTKSRSSNFKVEEKMPKAEGAKGGKCKKKRRRSLRHLRQEFRTGRSQGKLARTPDVTALPQSPSHHQVTKRRGGLIEEESLRPGRRHAPQGRGTHKAIRRHTKSFHISRFFSFQILFEAVLIFNLSPLLHTPTKKPGFKSVSRHSSSCPTLLAPIPSYSPWHLEGPSRASLHLPLPQTWLWLCCRC